MGGSCFSLKYGQHHLSDGETTPLEPVNARSACIAGRDHSKRDEVVKRLAGRCVTQSGLHGDLTNRQRNGDVHQNPEYRDPAPTAEYV